MVNNMDPCCGASLQTGTKIVAIVQMVLSMLVIISGIVMLSLSVVAGTIAANSEIDNHPSFPNGNTHMNTHKDMAVAFTVTAIVASVVILIAGLFGLIMSIILLKGSNQRNVRKCRVWLIIKSILLVISVITFCVNVSSEPKAEQAFSVIEIALSLYCMCVVYAFIKELREEEAASMPRNFYGGNNKA